MVYNYADRQLVYFKNLPEFLCAETLHVLAFVAMLDKKTTVWTSPDRGHAAYFPNFLAIDIII